MANVRQRIRWVLRFIRTGWSIAGLTLVAILLTEAGFRLVFAVKDHFTAVETPDPRVVEAGYGGETWPVQHYRELLLLQERWRPYVYFRQKPFSGETISIDQDGLRLTWEPPPAPVDRGSARAVKVLMLGGSSLWGFGARNDRTIPSLVARKLHEAGLPRRGEEPRGDRLCEHAGIRRAGPRAPVGIPAGPGHLLRRGE